MEGSYGMSIHATRLNEDDIDLHINDLVEFSPQGAIKTEDFWLRVKVFIASCGDYKDRVRLIPWWVRRKKQHMGGPA